MKRQLKVALFVLLTGVALLGTIFGHQKPPATLPLAVTIYDVDPFTQQECMWRSDGGGEYINGVDSVTATVDTQYGELRFNVPRTSPRRVLLEFIEAMKETCPNECKDKSGKTTLPPALGTVNEISISTYGRTAWSCESRWNVDCTQDFLHLIPGATGYTNSQIPFYAPSSSSSFFMLDYSRLCSEYKVIGYIFFEAGQDLNGDGYADEWDLFPVPAGYVLGGDMAHVYLKMPGGKNCSYGRYKVPFRIHFRKMI